MTDLHRNGKSTTRHGAGLTTDDEVPVVNKTYTETVGEMTHIPALVPVLGALDGSTAGREEICHRAIAEMENVPTEEDVNVVMTGLETGVPDPQNGGDGKRNWTSTHPENRDRKVQYRDVLRLTTKTPTIAHQRMPVVRSLEAQNGVGFVVLDGIASRARRHHTNQWLRVPQQLRRLRQKQAAVNRMMKRRGGVGHPGEVVGIKNGNDV